MTISRLFKQAFNSSGTYSWTCPAGVKFVFVTGCGGGGGGGGGAATSGTNSSGAWYWYYATGGSGGEPAPTFTQVVAVTPGVTYTISVAQGGAGGIPGFVYNGAPVVHNSITSNGGVQPGNYGSNGSASIFGTVTFPGGQGGRGGQIFFLNPAGASGSTNTNSQPQIFWEPGSSSAVPSGDPGSTRPSTTAPGADSFVAQGMFTSLVSVPAFPVSPGPSPVAPPATGALSGGGGGGGGGVSNNINSVGGGGGCGASASGCGPFSGGGGSGAFGGGGGGGGGGEGHIYNNTHDGSFGGTGGNGFIEISWMA